VLAHAYTAPEVLRRAARRHAAVLWVVCLASLASVVTVGMAWKQQGLERDRAIEAEQRSDLARQEADATLAISLAQQAHQLLLDASRPEAEVLAAGALAMGEDPTARGVLMAWHGLARPTLLGEQPLACERSMVGPSGEQVCAGDTIEAVDWEGRELWQVRDLQPDSPPDGDTWVGPIQRGRVYQDGMILVRAPHVVEIWARQHRLRSYSSIPFVQVARGPRMGFSTRHKVARVDPATGDLTWTDELCDEIEQAYITTDALAVSCTGGVVVLHADQTLSRYPVDGSPSTVALLNGLPVAGTFDGQLLSNRHGVWQSMPSGVGPVRSLEVLDNGQVAVLGERGHVRLWVPEAGVLQGSLAGRVRSLRAVDGGLMTHGDTLRRYALPAASAFALLDRADQGGFRFLTASDDGTSVMGASADGEIALWDVQSGHALFHRGQNPRVVPTGVMLGGTELLVSVNTSGTVWIDLATGESRVLSPSSARRMRRAGDRVVRMNYATVLVEGPALDPTDVNRQDLEAPMLAASNRLPLWLIDESGRGFRRMGQQLELQYRLEQTAGDIAEVGEGLAMTEGQDVVLRDPLGAEVWRWQGAGRLTAMDASDQHIVIGDDYGRISVLDASDGHLLATVIGHRRLVADVAVRGDVAFSASWDGTMRRWGLAATTADRETLAATVPRAWSMTVDDVLSASGAR
jgi:hypothetical protein